MKLFRRADLAVPVPAQGQHGPRLKSDLERFGRSQFDPVQQPWPWPAAFGEFVGPMHRRYRGDPDTFLNRLADVSERRGGWVAFGSARLVIEVAGGHLEHPAYPRIMDAALAFLRVIGFPPMWLNRFEWEYWLASGGTPDTWVPRRPVPALAQAPISALPVGERRRIVQLAAGPDAAAFVVRHGPQGRFGWLVDARTSEFDPRRAQRLKLTCDSLHELYVRIGLSLQIPPYWYHAELGPYFPLPRPAVF